MRWNLYLSLGCTAFLVRAAVFSLFVVPQEAYNQPDSVDYHQSAWCIANGYGMSAPNGRPMFWRTPGYPLYLAPFYAYYQATPQLRTAWPAQRAALWFQIALCSLIPALIALLGFLITGSMQVAAIVGWISVLHPGFVLASTYLLTDGLGLLFFVLFLCAFVCILGINSQIKVVQAAPLVCTGAILLALFTWIRPMGQLVAIGMIGVMILAQLPFKKIMLFAGIFFLSISPWLVRNYQLTGELFFCPLTGLYLTVFNAPKIVARVEHLSLKDAHAKLTKAASRDVIERCRLYQAQGIAHRVCSERVAFDTAWPHLAAHPGWALYDWAVEVCKTTFDLYSCQLVAIAERRAHYDPLVEYLSEKVRDCLWRANLGKLARAVGWFELVFMFILWTGLVGSAIHLMGCIIRRGWSFTYQMQFAQLFALTALIGALVVGPTGGYGYARLRIPAEPLMLILATVFWICVLRKHYSYETALCSLEE